MSTSGSKDLHFFSRCLFQCERIFVKSRKKCIFALIQGKKTDGKKRSLFYSLSEQPKLIAKSEKGKLYRVMHWCKAFFCNVRLKLLRYLMDILVFHVCKFIHCNVFLVQFSKCIHFSPYIPIRYRYRYACNTIFLFEFLRSVFVVFVLPCLLFHHSTSVAVFIPIPYTSCQYVWCISMFHYIFIIITCVCTRIWKFDWTDFQSMLCKQKNVANMRSFNKGKHMMMICMKQKIDDAVNKKYY